MPNTCDAERRPVPKWGWALACLTLPAGVFVVFAYARLLSWRRGITLAVISCACVFGFARLMGELESRAASPIATQLALTGGLLMFGLWIYLIHRIGWKANYWSSETLKGWRVAAWFAVGLSSLCLLGIALQIAVAVLERYNEIKK